MGEHAHTAPVIPNLLAATHIRQHRVSTGLGRVGYTLLNASDRVTGAFSRHDAQAQTQLLSALAYTGLAFALVVNRVFVIHFIVSCFSFDTSFGHCQGYNN